VPGSHQPSGEPGLADLVGVTGSVCGAGATGGATAAGGGAGTEFTRRRGSVFGLRGVWGDGAS
jgi:hypothetical protein